jgi:tRNA A-37 threonylcarbamoyl transferase component Bud32
MLVSGQVLSGTYLVERPLGSGGMADVYLVRHTRLSRHFALKVLKLELSSRPGLIERFRREAEVLARLRSPHIVGVVDLNHTDEGWPYLVMEYLLGETLAARIKRQGKLPIEAAVDLFGQLCDGVLAAHERDVIHRDLKPNNIFLSPGPRGDGVQILDFGIAKLCEEGRTPLGAILYEMLAGKPAFFVPGEPMMRTMQRLVYEDPKPLPESTLSPLLRRALNKRPADRYPSLRDLLADLRSLPTPRWLSPSEISPPAYERQHHEPHRTKRVWPVAALVFAVGVSAVSALWLGHRAPASPTPTPAVAPAPVAIVSPAPAATPPHDAPLVNQPKDETTLTPPALTKPTIPAPITKPRTAQKLHRSFVISGATSAQEKLLRLCADKELRELPGLYSTTLRLERTGALQLTQAPEVVYRSGFDACLRQAFAGTRTPLPELVTVKVQLQRQKP